jgi:Flp pilus assembly protein CpaB
VPKVVDRFSRLVHIPAAELGAPVRSLGEFLGLVPVLARLRRMEWVKEVAPALAGDAEARSRVEEALAPVVHGVLLAHAAHHLAAPAVAGVLTRLWAVLGTVPPGRVGGLAMDTARRAAKRLGSSDFEAVAPASARREVNLARAQLAKLAGLSETVREALVLRLVEGLPLPEVAALRSASPESLRQDYERSASAALGALGVSSRDLEYLWNFEGAPSIEFARLETQFTALRLEPRELLRETIDLHGGSSDADEGSISAAGDAPTQLESRERLQAALGQSSGNARDEETTRAVPRQRRPPELALEPEPMGSPVPQAKVQHSADLTPVRPPPPKPGPPYEPRPSHEQGGEPPPRAPSVRSGPSKRVRPAEPPRLDLRRRLFIAASALLGLALGGSSVWLAWRLWPVPKPPDVPVLVSARELAPFERLSASDLSIVEVPPASFTPDLLRASDAARLTGFELPVPWQKGDLLLAPLLQARPVPRWTTLGLAAPPSLELALGDRVDLRLTSSGKGKRRAETVTIARRLQIIALKQEPMRKKTAVTTVTLLLPAQDLTKLVPVMRLGRLSLARSTAEERLDSVARTLLETSAARSAAAQRRVALAKARSARAPSSADGGAP